MVKAATSVAIWRHFELDPLAGEANGAAAGSPEDNERVRRDKEAVAHRRADDHDENSQSNYQEFSPLLDFAALLRDSSSDSFNGITLPTLHSTVSQLARTGDYTNDPFNRPSAVPHNRTRRSVLG